MLRLGLVALAAGAGLTVHAIPRTAPDPAPINVFGSRHAVRIAHVGRIEVDLAAATRTRLHRVSCGQALPGTACYIGR